MVSISTRPRVSALNISTCLRLVVQDAGNDSSVSNTSDYGTNPLGLIVSFIAFIEIRRFKLLSRLGYVSIMTLNILLIG